MNMKLFFAGFCSAMAATSLVSLIHVKGSDKLAAKQADVLAQAKREITMKEKSAIIEGDTVAYNAPDTTYILTANDVRKMGFKPQ